MRTVAVVGTSLAGLRSIEALRRAGYDGRIVAIGAEPHLPYDRPPLSKELLAGRADPPDIVLRKQGVDDLDVDWTLGTPAVSLDSGSRELTLADGTRASFDGIVIATGSTPRRLPEQPDLEGVFMLRTLDDALALRTALDAMPKVVVIGAGFIGAEVAATCRGRGLDVTVLEALPQPMVRGLGPELGAVIADMHRDHGVDLRVSVQVEAIEGDTRVERVRLADGSTIAADVVVVGVGVVPATQWLEGSGLTLDNGVVCDATCLAAPGIVAAGDIARWPNPLFDGQLMRLEHWTNATEQGVHGAHRLLAGDDGGTEFAPVPFVWSDQYDRKIQTVGVVSADSEMHVAHGSYAERQFVSLFGQHGRIVGALGFNRPRQVMQYRKLISERAPWEAASSSRAHEHPVSSSRARIFTVPFTLVVLSGLCYFTALAMLTPVLPDYVEKSLGHGSIAVGIAVGAFAVGAVILRPFAGRIGDSVGRRVLIVGGALIVAVSTLGYGLVHELWFLVLLRVVSGFGEAGFFVGAATMITDLAPVDRRGEAVSYWSVAVYGGLSFGPILGSVLHGQRHYSAVWIVSAGLAFTAAAIGMFTVEVERSAPAQRPKHLFHRSAVGPGTVLFLGLIPLAGFTAFVPLYVDGLNVSAGAIFALYGLLVLMVRIFGARLPDRLGGRSTGTIALAGAGAGVGIIAAWPTVAGLVVGTIVFAAGMSLMYPALLLLALDGVSDGERASVVGTFSSFFDLSQGVGALICGMAVAASGDRGAFTTGAVCAIGGLIVLRASSITRTTPAAA